MRRCELRENGNTVTCIYDQPVAQNMQEAVNWLIGMEGIDGFETVYVALRDLSHSSDEGNASRQFGKDIDVAQLLKALKETSCERLHLAGRLCGVPVGIGISLKDFIPSITVPKEHVELAEKIEGFA